MTVAPDPGTVFDRAAEEGKRRLDQSRLELLSTGFIAGFTIVFGMVAMALVEGAIHHLAPEIAGLAGAFAFGVGLVFLIVGRAELFSENFFDPIAAAIEADGWLVGRLLRLWAGTFALNLVGGGLLVGLLSVEGALPAEATRALGRSATELLGRSPAVEFVRAFTGGALVALLSFLLQAVDGVGSRIPLAYAVGVLLALGPFDHVVVTLLHVVFGVLLGSSAEAISVAETATVVTAGNLVGGIGLVTTAHVGQALGAGAGSES